jgi:hypothetical protein
LKVFPPKMRPDKRKPISDQQSDRTALAAPQTAETQTGEPAPLSYPIPRTSTANGQGSA